MSDLKKRFDELTPPALTALNAKRDDFKNSFYDVDIAFVRRLIERISASLKRVDDKKLNHPTYLASQGQPIPEKAIQLISSMPSAINDSGMIHFINSVLPELVSVDESLSRAIGINEIRAADIKSSQLKAIERYVDWAKQAYGTISSHRSDSMTNAKVVEANLSGTNAQLLEAQANSRKIQELRATALRLSNGTKNSPALSSILKDAQAKLTDIEAARESADNAAQAAKELRAELERRQIDANDAVDSLQEQGKKARDILNNATQAGLAGAYKIERDQLARQQLWYAIVFYGIISLVIAYAAFFIVPIASQIIVIGDDKSEPIAESALLLFVRILIVLPAFWALIFTNKRFVYIETLQMDYAAKAVTALAYSGYRDEMGDDVALSNRLRGGLVDRFIEHPSRLLSDIKNRGTDLPFYAEKKSDHNEKNGDLSAEKNE